MTHLTETIGGRIYTVCRATAKPGDRVSPYLRLVDCRECLSSLKAARLRAAAEAVRQGGVSEAARAMALRLEPCEECGAEPCLVTDGSSSEMQTPHLAGCARGE